MKNIINETKYSISHFNVDGWILSCKEFLKRWNLVPWTFIDSLLDDITLVLSGEVIESPYAVKDLNYLKQEFIKRWPLLKPYMSNFNSVGELSNSISRLAERALSIESGNSYEDIVKEMIDLLEEAEDINGPFSFYVAGDYVNETKTIHLYVNVIEKSNNPSATYLEVFGHELFHALHFDNATLDNESSGVTDFDLVKRDDWTNTVVIESLAAYFEDAFNNYVGNGVDLKLDWDRFSPVSYPYSCAKYLDDSKFVNIYVTSYKDTDAALRELISDTNVFYSIKNKIKVRYHTITEKTTAPSTTLSFDAKRFLDYLITHSKCKKPYAYILAVLQAMDITGVYFDSSNIDFYIDEFSKGGSLYRNNCIPTALRYYKDFLA